MMLIFGGLTCVALRNGTCKYQLPAVPRRVMPRRAGDPPLLVASNRALIETLAWQPRFADIETIITHALKWERTLHTRS